MQLHAGRRPSLRTAAPAGASTGALSRANGRHRLRRVRVQATASSTERAVEEEQQELSDEKRQISELLNRPYKYGFKTYIESETFPKGLNEYVVAAISAKKDEPSW